MAEEAKAFPPSRHSALIGSSTPLASCVQGSHVVTHVRSDSSGLHSKTERVKEFLCKLGGRGHEAEVSAGKVDNIEA